MREYLEFKDEYSHYIVFTDSIEAVEEHYPHEITRTKGYLSIYLKGGTELEVNGNINQVIYGMEKAEKRK